LQIDDYKNYRISGTWKESAERMLSLPEKASMLEAPDFMLQSTKLQLNTA